MRTAGGLATAALLVAAVLFAPGPARLGRALYDGLVPLPPYHWVQPPRELARDNLAPEPGHATLDLDPSGKSPGSVATGDGQCTVIFNDGAVGVDPAGSTLIVTITPLDLASLAPPPAGMRFDGNPCRLEAIYGKSKTVPRYRRPVSVVLRYATGGTQIVLAVSGGQSAWEPIRTVRYAGHLHLLVADAPALGTFAPVAPAGTPYAQPAPLGEYAVAAALVVFVALVLLRRPWRRARAA